MLIPCVEKKKNNKSQVSPVKLSELASFLIIYSLKKNSLHSIIFKYQGFLEGETVVMGPIFMASTT